jgi:hypothetical protein
MFALRKDHGSKAARVIQTQHALRGEQVKVIVLASRWWMQRKRQTARHAQMHQQKTMIQVQQQILAAPPHCHHMLSYQALGVGLQGPP